MMEAAALRREDVDLKAGLVTITKTPHHTPKTRDSYRTIPVCGEVLEALKAAAGQKIRPAGGELFTTLEGELWTMPHLSHRLAAAKKAAAAALFEPQPEAEPTADERRHRERLASIPAHKLRAAFATLAGQMGAPDRTSSRPTWGMRRATSWARITGEWIWMNCGWFQA